MRIIDTHAHLYLDAFTDDADQVIENALKAGVEKILLPAIDQNSFGSQQALQARHPNRLWSMAGLHPTSVNNSLDAELAFLYQVLAENEFAGIGETGIDLYWDKSFFDYQAKAFRYQIESALQRNLPIAIHCREAFDQTIAILDEYQGSPLKGVFHAFSGNSFQAAEVIRRGFFLGIGGVVTFKNSGLAQVVRDMDPSFMVVETDAPFLAPAPFRGKRNEPARLPLVIQKMAELKNCDPDTMAETTSRNAEKLFPALFKSR